MKYMVIIIFLLIAAHVPAQVAVNSFTLNDVVHDTPVSLSQYASSSCIVVVFTSNACPYDAYYADRLADLIRMYSGRVPIILVNAHLDAEETEENMKIAAAKSNLSVPYLADKSQVAMEALNAHRSPEAFLLKPDHGKFSIMYSGAIDDNPQEPNAVNESYLKAAIDKVLAGQKLQAPPVRGAGCTIRKK